MKKIISLVLAIMLISVFCVPAFAEDAPIECKPDKNGRIVISKEGNYIIPESCTVEAMVMVPCTLTVPENVTVTVTGKIIISSSGATLRIFGTVDYSRGHEPISQDWIIVGDTGGYFGPNGEEILGKSFVQTDTSQSGPSTPEPHRYTTLFSGGNVTIIVGVACFAAGFLVAMFVFKKKKQPKGEE